MEDGTRIRLDVLQRAGGQCECTNHRHVAAGGRCNNFVEARSGRFVYLHGKTDELDNVRVLCAPCFQRNHHST